MLVKPKSIDDYMSGGLIIMIAMIGWTDGVLSVELAVMSVFLSITRESDVSRLNVCSIKLCSLQKLKSRQNNSYAHTHTHTDTHTNTTMYITVIC